MIEIFMMPGYKVEHQISLPEYCSIISVFNYPKHKEVLNMFQTTKEHAKHDFNPYRIGIWKLKTLKK